MKSALTNFSFHFHPLLPWVVLLPITPSDIFWMCLSKGDFAVNPSRIDSPSLIVSSSWLVSLCHFGNSPKPSGPLGIHLRVHTSGICVWAEQPSNHFIEATCIVLREQLEYFACGDLFSPQVYLCHHADGCFQLIGNSVCHSYILHTSTVILPKESDLAHLIA